MTLKLFQVDAFTSQTFGGNPAAVVPLERWPDDALLQAIAAENNLSETAYFVPGADGLRIRWFTPTCEVDLCGHATLATAFVIFTELENTRSEVRFNSRSGTLTVVRDGRLLVLDFPAINLVPAEAPRALLDALAAEPAEVLITEKNTDYFVRFDSEQVVRGLQPDQRLLESLHPHAVCVTAPGKEVDFVSRYFAPGYGIPEDPVTGLIHCSLTPYWAKRLGKTRLKAHQASKRGGELLVDDRHGRVGIAGQAVKYLEGSITV
jgi:PhzF family phenazine biosynthesis protein